MGEKKEVKISLGTAILISVIVILLLALAFVSTLYFTKVNEKNNESGKLEENISDIEEKNNINVEKQEKITDNVKFTINEYIDLLIPKYYNKDIPEFNSINDININNEWYIWGTVRNFGNKICENKNLNDSNGYNTLKYDEIIDIAKFIFGDKFNKKFPSDGTYEIQYNEENKQFILNGYMECDETMYNTAVIKNIEKNDNIYKVEIVEYIVYTATKEGNILFENEEGVYKLYDYKNNKIKEYKYIPKLENSELYDGNNKISEEDIKQYVIANSDKFAEKVLTIEIDKENNQLHLLSCENKKKINLSKNELIGTWNTYKAYDNDGNEKELDVLFGRSYNQGGSKLIINQDGTFQDYTKPIYSSEISVTGKWKFDSESNGIVLNYDDDSQKSGLVWKNDSNETVLTYIDDAYSLELKNS